MKIITADQGLPEWFAARLGVATGSNFSAVQARLKDGGEAATRAQYRVRLALERLTGELVEEQFKNQAMQDGNAREPIARSMYEFRRDEMVEEIGFCRHDSLECGVSPDGLVGSDGMVEIKCPTPAVHLAYLTRKDEPPEYRAQIQGQLWVCERNWVDFVSYQPSFPEKTRLLIRRVWRDEAYIKNLASAIEAFMAEVVATEKTIREMEVA